MRIIGTQRMFGRTAVVTAAACVLLLQTVIAGLAMGVSFSGAESQILRLVCSSGSSLDSSQEDRQTPASHHSGACCLLHNEAAVDPDPTPGSLLARSEPPTIVGLSPTPIDAIHVAPELGSRSARAPPPQFV